MMDSHIHMLVTARKAGAVACFLRRVLSSHALALNRVMERRGPLWEDRYRSVLVTDEEHALHASLYIDANPWRARVVDHPADSGWTSYRGLIRGQQDAFLVPHPVLMELGEGSDWRRRYGQIMNEYLRRASRTSMPRTWDPNTDPLAGLRLCTWRE
jgi:putative transposase